jgi:arabinogalactan oligomer/maltooligosaccharide transport system substrate-binding protein
MRTRTFGARAVSLLAASALVLAACGDDDDGGGDASEATGAAVTDAPPATDAAPSTGDTADATTDATTAAGTEAGGTAAPTVPARGSADLVIWADDTRTATVQAIAGTFAEENGITVEVQEVAGEEIRPSFILAAPTGDGPDIIVGAHDWIGELSTNGVLEPLELPNAADFNEASVEAFTFDGSLYGVPYAVENIALIRNTELVPEAPATWEEMVQIATDYKAENPDPTSLGIGLQVTSAGDAYHFQPVLSAFGGYMIGQNDDGTFDPSNIGLDSEGALAAGAFLAEAEAAGILNVDVTYDVMRTSFGEGNAPFAITGPWAIAQEDSGFAATGVPYEVTPIPPREGGDPVEVFVGVQGFMVSSFSQNVDLAKSFVQDFMSQEGQQLAMFEAGGRAPALTSAFEQVSDDPDVAGFGEAGANGVPLPAIPEAAAVFEAVGLAEANVLRGADPTQEFTNAATAVRE